MLRIYPLTTALLSLGRPILADREGGELQRVAMYVDAKEDLERSERFDVGDINHRNDQSSRGSFEEAKEKRFHQDVNHPRFVLVFYRISSECFLFAEFFLFF